MKKNYQMSYFQAPVSTFRDANGNLVHASLIPECSVSLSQIHRLITSDSRLAELTRRVRASFLYLPQKQKYRLELLRPFRPITPLTPPLLKQKTHKLLCFPPNFHYLCRREPHNETTMTIYVANPIYDSVFKYLMEDECFQAIEDRDTAIMNRDKRIAEQESRITEQESKITEQEECIRSLKGLVKGLLSGGMTIEQIAQMTGQTLEEIRSLL